MRPYLDVLKEAADHHSNGRLDEAAFLYEHLLGNQPDDAAILYLLGTLYSQRASFGSAITLLRAAVKASPELSEAWHNLGVAYRNEGHTDKARECYQRALAMDPDNADLLAMLAGSYINTGTPDFAVQNANKALAIDPDNPHALNHKALGLLEQGKWSEAWPLYENRFNLPNHSATRRPYTVPRWDGKPVKKLAIHGEQGLGDEIMFMSCFRDAAERAEAIVVECERRLIPLFERSFGVPCYGSHDELITAHPDVDAYIPMGSLPGLFRLSYLSFPGHTYLSADPERVEHYRKKLAELGDGPYIGIAWHGGTKGTHQELRNPPLEGWAGLVHGPATFIGVQYGEHGPMQAQEIGVAMFPEAMEDMDEFAALIAALDLVISPCQTAIHFAGAIGTECWCLTPSAPAWRYGVSGPMLWYGSHMRLIRQAGVDWESVFMEVGHNLLDFVRVYRAKPAAA